MSDEVPETADPKDGPTDGSPEGATVWPAYGTAAWLARFHAGDRAVLAACYRDHFGAVMGAVGKVLHGADQETVVHDVFLALIENEAMRRSFRGGALRSWLTTVAWRRAIDFARRRRRERPIAPDAAREMDGARGTSGPDAFAAVVDSEARALVARFRRERLPAKWAPVFEARFLRQLSQREAARALGMTRTTLAYQEARVRALLLRFVLAAEPGVREESRR